jgi:kynurenine formamidase
MPPRDVPMIRVDLSPAEYVHVPQAPRIERRAILARGAGNEWQMSGVVGVDAAGACAGVSSHTWSHVDAPFHLLPDGVPFERIPPAHYLVTRARVVDLTGRAAPERRERVDGVEYHTRIDEPDLPADAGEFEALLFVTGFGALIDRGYPMQNGADAHYPHLTETAVRRLAAWPSLRLVALDSPTVDKPESNAQAHRILLGRRPVPILPVETLTCERLRDALRPLPREVLLTVEPLRAFGPQADGALASVYAYAAADAEGDGFRTFARLIRAAKLIA